MSAKVPYPRAESVPKIIEPIKTISKVLFLESPVLSFTIETTVSISEIEEVRAANRTNTKNKVPITVPPVILSNTLGSVTNISPGPLPKALSSPPEKAKTAGIIIRPAKKAIPVSKISICLTELSRLTSFFI